MAFFAGRFARARGCSFFARQFNGELPRRMSPISVPSFSRLKLAEKPATGFAEQFPVLSMDGSWGGFGDGIKTEGEGDLTTIQVSDIITMISLKPTCIVGMEFLKEKILSRGLWL